MKTAPYVAVPATRVALISKDGQNCKKTVRDLHALGYAVDEVSLPPDGDPAAALDGVNADIVLLGRELTEEHAAAVPDMEARIGIPVACLVDPEAQDYERRYATEHHRYIPYPVEARHLRLALSHARYRHGSESLNHWTNRFRSAFERMPIGVIGLCRQRQILFVNKSGNRLVDHGQDDPVGRDWQDILRFGDESIAHAVAANIDQAFADPHGHGEQLEVRLDRRDGKPVVAMLWASPMLDADDGLKGVMLVLVDVTEHTEVRESLAGEKAFLRALLDNIGDGVVACDAEGTLTLFNSATRRMHGLPEQSLVPADWSAHYSLYQPGGERPLAIEDIPLYRAWRGESVHDAEIEILPRDGERRIVKTNGQPIRDDNGRLLGAVATMQDITQARRPSRSCAAWPSATM